MSSKLLDVAIAISWLKELKSIMKTRSDRTALVGLFPRTLNDPEHSLLGGSPDQIR